MGQNELPWDGRRVPERMGCKIAVPCKRNDLNIVNQKTVLSYALHMGEKVYVLNEEKLYVLSSIKKHCCPIWNGSATNPGNNYKANNMKNN